MANKAIVPCADCGKTIVLGGQSKPPGEARCRPCFLEDKARNFKHGTGGYTRGCRCDECRLAVNAANRERYKKIDNRYGYVPQERFCVICKAAYMPRHHIAKTCSVECSKQLRCVKAWDYEARKRGAFVERVIPSDIFERDGWRCHICRRKLSAKTKWPHPRTPSIDHLVPLTRGGLHESSNVQTACLSCNSSKGNRGGNEQLLLIG